MSKDNSLYRVMTLEQFIDMMAGKFRKKYESELPLNTLVRPWMWEDPYEKLLKDIKVSQAQFHFKRWFGQCWSLTEENDSLWRMVSQNKAIRCVRIKVSIDNLKDSLRSFNADNAYFLLDAVNYLNEVDIDYFVETSSHIPKYAKIFPKLKEYELGAESIILLTKRPAFWSENEVRLLIYDKRAKAKHKTWSYDFDVNKYVEEIVFDPWTPDYYYDSYRILLERIGVEDVKKKVKFSKLYKPLTIKENNNSRIK